MEENTLKYLREEAADPVAALQELIDTGHAWRMQGSVGRAAMYALEAGICILGEQGHNDYWGNYVPSRYEVKPGTKGSVEYAARAQEMEV
jgi:hypothetical protein